MIVTNSTECKGDGNNEAAREIMRRKGIKSGTYNGPMRPWSPEEIDQLEAKFAETKSEPAPSLEIAKQFWAAFSPNDPSIRLRFVMFDRSAKAKEVIADSVDAAWPHVLDFQSKGYECYFFPNKVPADAGSGWGGMAEDQDVEAVRAIFVDFDHGLPKQFHAEPSFIVHSSKGKAQTFWLASDCPVEDFRGYQEQLLTYYAGVTPDGAVINPSRIMRLPGSLHQKDAAARQLVTFERVYGGQERSTWDLTEMLPEAAPRKTKSNAAPEERHKVPVADLMAVLPFVDPSVPGRGRWMGIISGLKNSDFTGAPEDFDPEEIAVRWSAGELWSGPKEAPQWLSDGTPANYEGGSEKNPIPGDVATRDAFRTSDGNSTFGTLIHHAKVGGWKGNAPWEPGTIIYPPQTKEEKKMAAEQIETEEGGPYAKWTDKERADKDRYMAGVSPESDDIDGLYKSIDDYMDNPATPTVAVLIPKWLAKGRFVPFVGAGGSFKSQVVLQAITALCYGRDFMRLGMPAPPADAIEHIEYLSYEDDEKKITRRLHELRDALRLKTEQKRVSVQIADFSKKKWPLLYVRETGDVVLTRTGLAALRRLEKRRGHKLVILDNLTDAARFVGQAKINDGAVRQFVNLMHHWCDLLDLTILAPMHPSRAGAARQDTGHSAEFENAPRQIWRMSEQVIPASKRTGGRIIKTGKYCFEIFKWNDDAKSEAVMVRGADGVMRPESVGENLSAMPVMVAAEILRALYDDDYAAVTNGASPEQLAAIDERVRSKPRLRREGSYGNSRKKIDREHWLLDSFLQRTGKACSVDEFLNAATAAAEMGLLGYVESDPEKRGLKHRDPAGYCRPVNGFAEADTFSMNA
jgi:hypothetical protein